MSMIYDSNIVISNHFNSNEFRCSHCGKIKISRELVLKVEELISVLGASKCIVSSGYRCEYYDKRQNGFVGRHSEGIAMDCCFYDKKGNIISSKLVCCKAYDMGFRGIAYIDNNYVHLDIRTNGTYYGDETRGNSSYWSDPYEYFGISKNSDDIKYQVHGLGKKWYSNVYVGTNDYAGVFGVAMDGVYIDSLRYRVKVNGRWLGEVNGRIDYAGIFGNSITSVAINGNVLYRVHNKYKNYWLDWVDGNNYNIYDRENGYAGNDSIIDALQIKRK